MGRKSYAPRRHGSRKGEKKEKKGGVGFSLLSVFIRFSDPRQCKRGRKRGRLKKGVLVGEGKERRISREESSLFHPFRPDASLAFGRKKKD